MKSKAEIMRAMRAKRKAAGLSVLSVYVTAENKDKILENLALCKTCESAYFIKHPCHFDD